jgi:nonribosomal peptide synthetase DhbF
MTSQRWHFLDVLADVVAHHGTHIAVEDDRGALSYADLWRASGAVAGALERRGVTAGDVVGVRLPRSSDAIVAMLAIWRAGAAYFPIDPEWPDERVDFVQRNAGVRTIIDASWGPLDAEGDAPATDRWRSVAPDDPAYVIYTSGSTGTPKGVVVPHRGLVPVLAAQIEELVLGPGKRCLFVLSLAFDASLSDIGTALLSGATLVVAPTETTRSAARIAEALQRHRITHVDLPPAMLRRLDASARPSSLEHVVVGGEVCPAEVLRTWAREVRVTVAYGPTEATICTSMARCDPETWSRPLVGRPLPGVVYAIASAFGALDADEPDEGELLVSCPGLALGYLGRPDLDRERFVVVRGRRWFRTGDRVRRAGGEIELFGRIDRQLKVRGALVAPEEIEARLSSHPGVRRAAVVWRGLAPDGPMGLVAFVEAGPSVSERALRAHVISALPRYMCPQRFELVGELPWTASGKVDLEALRQRPLSARSVAPPRNPREELLARCFADVVGVREVSRESDFFALGGDSFAVIELVAAARGRGLLFEPSEVYDHPVLAELAEVARTADNAHPADAMTAEELRAKVRALLAHLPARAPSPAAWTPGEVLVTGATGFLGARLTKALLERAPDRAVTCLVRAPSDDAARARLARALAMPLDELARIRVVRGDVAQPRLGLALEEWRRLAEHAAEIFHMAAAVDMVRPFRELRAPNLHGTVEMVRLSREGRPKRLHLASTLSVFVATDRHEGLLREDDDLAATRTVFGGYAQTKWAAEVAVRAACPLVPGPAQPGATIHRLGLLTSDAHPFAPPRGCQLSMFVRGLAELGAVPDVDLDALAVDVTPVGYAARAFVELALGGHGGTFHVANPRSLSLRRIVDAVERHTRRRLARVPLDELARASAASSDAATVLVSLARRSGAGHGRATDLFLATRADFDTSRTNAVLTRAGLVCPPPEEILEAHVRHLLERVTS